MHYLRIVKAADRRASRYISLHDIGKDFDVVLVREDVKTLGCLSHERVPLNWQLNMANL